MHISKPIKKRCSLTAVVMWTNTLSTDFRGWFPYHFVPLISEDLVAKSSKTYAQVSADDKAANIMKKTSRNWEKKL